MESHEQSGDTDIDGETASSPSTLSCLFPFPCSFSRSSIFSSMISCLFFPPSSASTSHHLLPGYLCLPSQLQFFHKHILRSRNLLSLYYLCYLIIILVFIYFIVEESPAMFHDNQSSTFYNCYFIFQTTVILALFPSQIHFLNETLSSDDLPLMLAEVMRYDQRFQPRILLLSVLNSFGFFISLLIYGISVMGDPYRRAAEIVFFLLMLFPLPMCITMTLILMDCHRRLADRFIEFLKYPTSSLLETTDNSPSSSAGTNSQLLFSSSSKLFELNAPLLSLPFSFSSHIFSIHSQYLSLRDGFLFTSIHRGPFISVLSLNSLLLMGYLLWTVYLYSVSFFSIIGFMIVDLFILVEVFVWTSLANESGHLVSEALADHSLRLITQDGITAEQVQLLHHLISCLPHARLEVYGFGRVTVRFKLAATITVGFAAAIIPKLIFSQ